MLDLDLQNDLLEIEERIKKINEEIEQYDDVLSEYEDIDIETLPLVIKCGIEKIKKSKCNLEKRLLLCKNMISIYNTMNNEKTNIEEPKEKTIRFPEAEHRDKMILHCVHDYQEKKYKINDFHVDHKNTIHIDFIKEDE